MALTAKLCMTTGVPAAATRFISAPFCWVTYQGPSGAPFQPPIVDSRKIQSRSRDWPRRNASACWFG